MIEDRIEIRSGYEIYPVEHFVFPGGELQVKAHVPKDDILVTARLASAEGLLKLVLASEIVRRNATGRASLAMPYFPYGQQDRVMEEGESFSLRAVAAIINSLGYDRVAICDPHSDVTPALLDGARVVHQHEIIERHPEMRRCLGRDDAIVVAPDAGSAKKAAKVAAMFGRPLICGSKARDTATGALTDISLPEAPAAAGMRAVIVDDICVGGATFIGLARKLREAGARHVLLYVTHGIFSRGLGPFVGLFDWLLTTDTFAGCPEAGNSDIPLYRFPVGELIRSKLA